MEREGRAPAQASSCVPCRAVLELAALAEGLDPPGTVHRLTVPGPIRVRVAMMGMLTELLMTTEPLVLHHDGGMPAGLPGALQG